MNIMRHDTEENLFNSSFRDQFYYVFKNYEFYSIVQFMSKYPLSLKTEYSSKNLPEISTAENPSSSARATRRSFSTPDICAFFLEKIPSGVNWPQAKRGKTAPCLCGFSQKIRVPSRGQKSRSA